jgi:hypothetical protein
MELRVDIIDTIFNKLPPEVVSNMSNNYEYAQIEFIKNVKLVEPNANVYGTVESGIQRASFDIKGAFVLDTYIDRPDYIQSICESFGLFVIVTGGKMYGWIPIISGNGRTSMCMKHDVKTIHSEAHVKTVTNRWGDDVLSLTEQTIQKIRDHVIKKLTVVGSGGGRLQNNKGAKWVRTARKATINGKRGKPAVKKTVYCNSATGEMRVRKMVPRRDGTVRATYVKF